LIVRMAAENRDWGYRRITTPGDENRVLRSAPHMERSPAVKAGARL
jgi:hypothetical protein